MGDESNGNGRGDFIDPGVDRVKLSGGRFIDVKHRLNAGETRRVFSRMVKRMVAGEAIELDPQKVGFTKLSESIVGWSLADADGRPIPLSDSAIDNLDPDVYHEIARAVDNHEAEVEAAIALEKKGQGGESASLPTLPSANG
jgi:hypothetical protein